MINVVVCKNGVLKKCPKRFTKVIKGDDMNWRVALGDVLKGIVNNNELKQGYIKRINMRGDTEVSILEDGQLVEMVVRQVSKGANWSIDVENDKERLVILG